MKNWQTKQCAKECIDYTHQTSVHPIHEQRTGQSACTVEYTYDKVGNRLRRTRTLNGQTTVDVLSYNVANQLETLNGQSWAYDADGNVVV
ncbi:MAG: hypothetical protein QXI60_08595 [Thermofilaceae archaeon]